MTLDAIIAGLPDESEMRLIKSVHVSKDVWDEMMKLCVPDKGLVTITIAGLPIYLDPNLPSESIVKNWVQP